MAMSMFSVQDPASGTGIKSEGLLPSLALAERTLAIALTDTVDLFDTPIVYGTGANVRGTGSDVLRFRLIQLGWNLSMTATANEDTDVSASSVTGSYADVTVTRRALRLDETDLAQVVGGAWGFDPMELGATLAGSFRAGRMAALGTTIAGATTNITSTGTGSYTDLLDVKDSFSTTSNYSGLLIGMLHPVTAQSIRDSLLSEIGTLSQRADVQQYLAAGGEELLGTIVYLSTHVTSASSKYENAFMAPGAIAYAVGSTEGVILNDGNMRPAGLPLTVEPDRHPGQTVTRIVGNGFDGQAIREQARIRGLLAATS